jgi:hypothetical protein
VSRGARDAIAGPGAARARAASAAIALVLVLALFAPGAPEGRGGAFGAAPGPVRAGPDLAVLPVERILERDAGGDYTHALVVESAGRKLFLKSARTKLHRVPAPARSPGASGGGAGTVPVPVPVRLTRSANFEADIVAHALFSLAGVQCPRARVVRLAAGTEAERALGGVALAMEFVDDGFAGCEVKPGGWPGPERADLDAFMHLALIDILIANADRRDRNFFLATRAAAKPPLARPIPIDNNSGLASFLVWTMPSNLVNFFEGYDGIGRGWPWSIAGTIDNIVVRGGEVKNVHARVLSGPALRPRVLALAGRLVRRLTDGEIERAIRSLPPEIIPPDAVVDPGAEWAAGAVASAAVPPGILFGPIRRPVRGPELFAHRVVEIGRVLRARRDGLVTALQAYFERHASPASARRQGGATGR